MMLHWGKEHLQETLPDDIAARFFQECDTDHPVQFAAEGSFRHPCYNGKTGEVLINLPVPPVRRYSRAKVVKLLSEGIDVRYGKKLIDISIEGDNVTAKFEDGSMESGSLLVGADSANSFVRSWLFDHQEFAGASDLPMIVYNFPMSFPRELALQIKNLPDGVQRLSVHPDHNTWWVIMNLQVDEDVPPEEWVFQMFFTHWSEQLGSDHPAERMKHFKMLGETYAEPWRAVARAVDENRVLPNDRLKHWKNPRLWNNRNGRVTLAGDAAHPFPPRECSEPSRLCRLLTIINADRGQGLNNSFQDAANFVKAITSARNDSGKTMSTALAEYDEEVFERGKLEMETSAKQAFSATHFEEYLESASVKYGVKPLPR